MKKALLNNPIQVAANQATHVFELGPTDLDAQTTVNTDLTITLMAVPAGSVVLQARAVLLENFGNASADTTLAFSVGVAGLATNVIGAQTLINAGSPTAQPRQWAASPNVSANSDTNLTITFDITDTDGKLSDVNTGQLRVYVLLKTIGPERAASL
jgi:hypothetical protein